jgi:hypothetical protein
MRPSISEQLEQVRRILDDVVAPHVDEPYPQDILGGLGNTLSGLAASWHRVPAFLQWDVEQVRQLLTGWLRLGGPEVDPGDTAVADVVRTALALPRPSDNPLDFDALDEYDGRLRAALQAVVPSVAARSEFTEFRSRLTDYFSARVDRYPIVLAPPPAFAPRRA